MSLVYSTDNEDPTTLKDKCSFIMRNRKEIDSFEQSCFGEIVRDSDWYRKKALEMK